MPAAFALSHTFVMRASTCEETEKPVPYQRSCVFSPSLSRMITWFVSGGRVAAFIGLLEVKVCQAHASPIVWLVLPFGTIVSTFALKADQSFVSPVRATGHASCC